MERAPDVGSAFRERLTELQTMLGRESPRADLPETLSRTQIQTGMAGIRPKVHACGAQYRVPGTLNVDVTISPAGRVQSAVVTGKFAGTPTGYCVAEAVLAATFASFSGDPIRVAYPFVMP